MRIIGHFAALLAIAGSACRAVDTPARAEPGPRDAVGLIVEAFEKHPIVALSEGAGHGQVETRDFFIRLIRDPRFPRAVRNIVIEFGNARYQAVMDRFVAGEPVSRDELRRVWEDTTQVTGVWSAPMYGRMLAEVRAVNATLPPAVRLRVLLGDPPIDWTRVTGPADEDMNDWRDAHFAHVVEREVLSQDGTALLLIGGAHISRTVRFPNSLVHLLDARFPGRTWVVGVLDIRYVEPGVATRLRAWTVPAGVSVRNTWLGKLDVHEIGFRLSDGGAVEDDVDAIVLLNHAPPRQEESPVLDATYRRELARRRALGAATLPFRGGTIRFEENAAVLASESAEPLQAVLRELLRDHRLRLLVKAFADRTERDPAALSMRRAAILAEWLSRRGVERDRLMPTGCGAARPLTFGRTAADRARNRRAELVRFTPTAGCEPPW